ncbi:MAG: HAD family hydrolase [Spirochaeta sp.]
MLHSVWFDFGDTVLDFYAADTSAGIAAVLQKALGEPPGPRLQKKAQQRSRHLNEIFNQRAEVSSLEYDQYGFQRLLYEPLVGKISPQLLDEMVTVYWDNSMSFRAQPGIHEALDWLEQQGMQTGIISNSSFPAELLERELVRHGLGERFSPIISTVEYGLRKPAVELFELAEALVRVQNPSEKITFWYIGNSIPHDVHGALAAGWNAAWYNRGGESRRGCPSTVAELHSWGDLPAVIQTRMKEGI